MSALAKVSPAGKAPRAPVTARKPGASIADVAPTEPYATKTSAFFSSFIEGYGTMDAIAAHIWDQEPYFEELNLALTIPADDEPLNHDDEALSLREAMHEDLYFSLLEYFGQLSGRPIGDRHLQPGRLGGVERRPQHREIGGHEAVVAGLHPSLVRLGPGDEDADGQRIGRRGRQAQHEGSERADTREDSGAAGGGRKLHGMPFASWRVK